MRTVRSLDAAEVDLLMQWAAAEGWNPGIGDGAAFRATDPDGFLGAFVDGEMVAGISAVRYGENFGFIGLYICRPDQRGQGHGRAVWNTGMSRLDGRTIGLDGVPEQQANYRLMGFEPSYETVRMTGRIDRPVAAATVVRSANEIAVIDAECFPAPRAAFLTEWIAPPRRVLALAGGYGAVRRCVTDSKIGPLFAPDAQTAFALMSALSSETVSIDVPVARAEFIAALSAQGFTAGFSTTRMYRGGNPGSSATQVFGVTTLELG